MKKILVMAFALIIGSVAVYAQSSENALCLQTKKVSTAYCAHNQDVCTRCPVCEHGQLIYCEDLPEGSQRSCCYRQKPTGAKGGDRGGKGGNSVCEKLIWPQIVHRPRCSDFGPSQCKQYDPIKHCEDFYGQETHGKIPACCWVGMQPNEVGGRGGKGGAKSGSGVNGIYYCTDPGAENMPPCTNPAQTDKKCCYPVYYKGGQKGSSKGAESKGPKDAPKVTAPVRGTKGSATIVKPSKTIEKPVVLSKEVK